MIVVCFFREITFNIYFYILEQFKINLITYPLRFGLIKGSGKGIGLSIIKKLLIENKDIKVLGFYKNTKKDIERFKILSKKISF